MRFKPGVPYADFWFIWFLMRLGLFGLLGFFALGFLVSLGFLGALGLDSLGVLRHYLLGPWWFLQRARDVAALDTTSRLRTCSPACSDADRIGSFQ